MGRCEGEAREVRTFQARVVVGVDYTLRVLPGRFARGSSVAIAFCTGTGCDSADSFSGELVAFGQGTRSIGDGGQLAGEFRRGAVELGDVRERSVRKFALPGRTEFAVHTCK